jgi:hypothetical protein
MDSGIPFIDLLINFTTSPYSTYFYTGSFHVQYVALQEYFSHPRLVIYFFLNLTHKTETWTPKGERPNSTSNPHDQSKYLTNQQQVLGVSLPFASLFILCKMFGGNHFAEPSPHVLTLYMIDIFAGSHTEHRWRSQLTLPFQGSMVLMFTTNNNIQCKLILHPFSSPLPLPKHEKMSSIQ